jgi:hypothetical protein
VSLPLDARGRAGRSRSDVDADRLQTLSGTFVGPGICRK